MEAGGEGSNKNKILMIVIIALLVVLLAAMGFVAFMVFGIMRGGDDQGPQANFMGAELRPEELHLVEFSQPISTNVRSETGASHVIRTSFVVAVDNTQGRTSNDLIELLATSDSIMRSVALHVVRSRTFEELSHPDAMSFLEQEVLEQLRHEFGSNLIHRVVIGGDWFLD